MRARTARGCCCSPRASPLAAQTVAITDGTRRARRRVGADRRAARSSSATAGSSPPARMSRCRPAPRSSMRRGKWVTPGIVAGFSRLGLVEVDLGGRRHPTTPTTRRRPVQRRDRRRAGDQSAGIDHRGQPRRRRDPRASSRRSPARTSSPGRARSSTLGDDMDAVHRAPRASSSSSWARAAPATPAARAHRRIRPVPQRLARGAELRVCDARRRRRTRQDPSSAIPMNRDLARRPAQRRRAADPLRRRGAGAGGAGQAVAARPCRAGQRHPASPRAAARISRACKIVLVGATEGWTVADQIAASGVSGDRLGAQRPARRASKCWPRPSPISAGCARPASRSRSA